MILNHLSEAQLQTAIGEHILQRLETLGPVVLGEDADPTRLYKKRNLLRILSAFGPSERMRDREFMRDLLNALPASTLNKISDETGVGTSSVSFASRRDALVKMGWSDVEFCRKFVSAAGLPDTFLPAARAHVPSEELVAPVTVPFKRLKAYQLGVHRAAVEALTPSLARFVVQMPTGSGKTRTAMEVIADVLNGEALGLPKEPRTLVWLAHAEELCEQAIQCFREVWAHLGTCQCRVARLFGEHGKPLAKHDGPTLLVAGFQKAYSVLNRSPAHIKALAESVDLLIIDEAHKVLAPTYKAVASALIGRRTRVMGLTATPGRVAADDAENGRLAEFFFGKVVPLAAPAGQSVISYLRQLGVLAKARMERLETSSTVQLTDAQIKAIERELDFPPGVLAKLGADDYRNVEIINRLKEICAHNGRVLFFACSVEHSRFICALLVYLGIAAAHVDGGTPYAERQAAIAGFRGDGVQVLCNYGILSTGFDAPKTDVVFISRPTKSIVLYSQMIGRGLRGPAIGGTPECLLVNVIDNIVGLPDNDDIYDYFDSYWTSAA